MVVQSRHVHAPTCPVVETLHTLLRISLTDSNNILSISGADIPCNPEALRILASQAANGASQEADNCYRPTSPPPIPQIWQVSLSFQRSFWEYCLPEARRPLRLLFRLCNNAKLARDTCVCSTPFLTAAAEIIIGILPS